MNSKININKIINDQTYHCLRFHKKTELHKFNIEFDPKDWPKEWKDIYYKSYVRLPFIKLPTPLLKKKISLKKVLQERRSQRIFNNTKITKRQLSTLFYYSAGIKNKNISGAQEYNRFYPSAGARYPLEIYAISLNTELSSGLYHYCLKINGLECLLHEKIFIDPFFNQKWVKKSSMLIVITAFFQRSLVKYGERGYRYCLLEAGHVCQNISLISEAVGLVSCQIGGYIDTKLNNLLDIDGLNETVISVIAIGNKI